MYKDKLSSTQNMLYMKSILLACVAINCMFFCNKETKPGLPACVQQRIAQIKQQPKWNPAATINEYRYNGKTVYLVSANCCDQYTSVINQDCDTICAPGGGFTGGGDGRCADFDKKAQLVRLVWKDDR